MCLQLAAKLNWPTYAVDIQPLCVQHVLTSSSENSVQNLIQAFNIALVDRTIPTAGSSNEHTLVDRLMIRNDRCKSHFVLADLESQGADKGDLDEDDDESW